MSGETLPFTVLVPDVPGEAIEFIDRGHALRLAFVHRNYVPRLDQQKWDVGGIYILLDPVTAEGSWAAYVGKATGVKTRLGQHVLSKDGWQRALLVVSNQNEPFNSSEIGWLEGQVHSNLVNSYFAEVSNRQSPGDGSVSPWDQIRLFAIAEGVGRALRLLGYETAGEEEINASERSLRTRASTSRVTLADLFTHGILTDGERLVSLNGQWPAEATASAPGSIDYLGKSYSKPSAAASVVRQGGETNGWTFWGVSRGGRVIPLAILRAEIDAQQA